MEGIGRTNPVGQLGEPTLLPVGRSTRRGERVGQVDSLFLAHCDSELPSAVQPHGWKKVSAHKFWTAWKQWRTRNAHSSLDCKNSLEMLVHLSPFFLLTCGSALGHVSNPVRDATDGTVVSYIGTRKHIAISLLMIMFSGAEKRSEVRRLHTHVQKKFM